MWEGENWMHSLLYSVTLVCVCVMGGRRSKQVY